MAAKTNFFDTHLPPRKEEGAKQMLDRILGRTPKKNEDKITADMSAEEISDLISRKIGKIIDDEFAKIRQ